MATGTALRAAWAQLEPGGSAIAVAAAGIGAVAASSAAPLPEPPALELSINAAAERALAQYLRASPEREGMLATTTYNYSGMLDSLGASDLRPITIHPVLSTCGPAATRRPTRRHVGARPPLPRPATRAPARHPADLPLRAVVPTRVSVIDESYAAALEPALGDAAAARGATMRIEQTFTTSEGAPVLRVGPRP